MTDERVVKGDLFLKTVVAMIGTLALIIGVAIVIGFVVGL